MPIARTDLTQSGPNSPPPEFGWFHIVLTTYGAWLPGDARGFRTRGHRQYVTGDYKSPPPPGRYATKLQHSETLLQHEVVQLDFSCRAIIGEALVGRLGELRSFVLAAAVASRHVHLVAKLSPKETREVIGAAKRHAWYELRSAGWQQKLWAKRGKCTPVKDRRHLQNALRYVIAYEKQRAWVWVRPSLSDALVESLRS